MDVEQIDRHWFVTHSVVKDPDLAWHNWDEDYRKSRNRDELPLKLKLLQHACGVARATIQLWDSPTGWQQLGDDTLWDLDYVAHVLGIATPARRRAAPRQRQEQRGARRILLLVNLDA